MREFILSPIYAYLKAFRYPTRKESRIAIILFCTLFGFLMNTESESADLYRYLLCLESADSVGEVIQNFLSHDLTDLYTHVSIAIISVFTTNGHVLMCWFGFVYGWLVAQNLKYFDEANNSLSFSVVYLFFILAGLHGLAGVRHITASFTFLLGLNKIIFDDEKRKGALIMLSSALIHFSFIMMIVVFAIAYFLRNKTKMCGVIFGISFFLTIPTISNYISIVADAMGGAFSNRADIYSLSNDAYIDSIQEAVSHNSWFIKYKSDTYLCGIALFGLILLRKWRKITVTDNQVHLLNFFFLMFAFRNIVVNIPDVGVRVTGFCTNIALYLVFLLYNGNANNRHLKIGTIVVFAAAFLSLAYAVRTTFYYVSVWEIAVTPILSVPVKMIDYLF